MYCAYLCNNIVGTVPRNNGDSPENLWSGSQGCEIRRGPHTVTAPRAQVTKHRFSRPSDVVVLSGDETEKRHKK